VGSRNSGLKSA